MRISNEIQTQQVKEALVAEAKGHLLHIVERYALDLRDERAENARLQARITELEGRSGYCAECERLARRVGELEAAMCRIHEGCCRQLAEPRDHGNDQYCMTDCATVAEEALAAIAARKKEANG
jgi:hypothetical protein